MSRRDIIIITVLINAGLLAILFMTATNTDQDQVVHQPEINLALATASEIPRSRPPVSIQHKEEPVADEVDSVIRDFVGASSQTIVLEEENDLDGENATAAAVQEEENSSGPYVEVKVKRGDFLEKIARANGTSVEVIKKTNHLASEKIAVGQVLRIPLKSPKTPSGAVQAASISVAKVVESKIISQGDPQYYTIKSGDNPWKIAKQYQVKFEELLKLNNLDEEKARSLKIGDKIRVK